jgi:hypothetical protein
LRYPEPVQELHRNIGAGVRRFLVRALHVDRIIAVLDSEMSTFGGRWRRRCNSGNCWSRTAGGRRWRLRERGVCEESRRNAETYG